MIFATVNSTHFSPEQLYGARTWLERVGKTDEHNALMAFLDSKTWVGKIGSRGLEGVLGTAQRNV